MSRGRIHPVFVTVVTGFIAGIVIGGMAGDFTAFVVRKVRGGTRAASLAGAGRLSSEGRTEEALRAYREILQSVTREQDPVRYAKAENGLGLTLARLAEKTGDRETLGEAAAAFRRALRVYTRQRDPENHAAVQTNLGNVLMSLASGGGSAPADAVAAYTAALGVYTPGDAPLQYAGASGGLGLARLAAARLTGDAADFHAALRPLEEAAKVYTPDRYPEQHREVSAALREAREGAARPSAKGGRRR